jgi:DNA-binding PadR family transcriptional regulator
MPLPNVTHLQFLVLTTLLAGEQPGRRVREELAEWGVPAGGPAFYQMMARLENAGFLEGRYDEKVVGGQRIKERYYRLTAAGRAARRGAEEFYKRNSP